MVLRRREPDTLAGANFYKNVMKFGGPPLHQAGDHIIAATLTDQGVESI